MAVKLPKGLRESREARNRWARSQTNYAGNHATILEERTLGPDLVARLLQLPKGKPFWLVTFYRHPPADARWGIGALEAKVFPPRPEDGPMGDGWLVTDTRLGGELDDVTGVFTSPWDKPFQSLEAALEALEHQFRVHDAVMRLEGTPWP